MEDSDQQSTESGAMIGSNDDLLTEILFRVPATSILRFKFVSKHWRLLLSDRHFTLRYDNHNLSKSTGLFGRSVYVPLDVENRSPPPFRSLDFYPDPCGIRIVQSCNGLMLCCSDLRTQLARKYYVFNPTTKQFAIIPPLRGGYKVCEKIVSMRMAFHPTDCVCYKVVCILKKEPEGEFFQIQIYSSDTREWKICREFFTDLPMIVEGVYWNGAIHWTSSFRRHFYFHIKDEQLQSLPLPVEMTRLDTWTLHFGESRGHLHLVVDNDHNTSLSLNVYEMLSDHSGWFVKYQVDIDENEDAFANVNYSSGYYYDVIDVVRGEKEEDTFIVMIIFGKIITYNVYDKSFKQISDLANYSYYEFSNCHRYVESLSSF